MNIDILNTTLEVTENPGLDIIDPRLMDIAGLVENAEYMEAAVQAEQVLEEGVYDIRIAGYFLYGVFLEQGVGTMAAIMGCLANLLTENWEALGPVKNREKHAQTSLNWFLRQLAKKLQYEEEKESDVYQRWVDEVNSDDVEEALEASEEFKQALGMTLEDFAEPLLESLPKVNDWLRSFQHVVYREPEPEPELEEEYEPGEEVESAAAAPSPLTADDAVLAEGSYHLGLLQRKMAAFERLLAKEQYPKAAIVADDINNIIANFDPRIYFPKIFSNYSLLRALNIGELTAFGENRGSVEWQTMEDLYKVDLDSFVALDSDVQFSSTPAEREYQGEEEYEEETDAESGDSEEEW
ncbi:MAG: hypothetical protein JRD00_01180 [Deltaproteobacteria bacterium]|jgi:hypothetical protein|nr:hypothetical protein [Deltaproteobacteria bacterium]